MDRRIAERLVDELQRQHPELPTIAAHRTAMLDGIAAVQFKPYSRRFSEKLPDAEYLLAEEGGDYHWLHLRRVLRNRNARALLRNEDLDMMFSGDYGKVVVSDLPLWKRLADDLYSLGGMYSSDVLTRRLRQDARLLRGMEAVQVDHPLTLLAKLETHSAVQGYDKRTAIAATPLVVIPGADADMVAYAKQWSEAHTQYWRQVMSFPLPLTIPTSRGTYLKLCG